MTLMTVGPESLTLTVTTTRNNCFAVKERCGYAPSAAVGRSSGAARRGVTARALFTRGVLSRLLPLLAMLWLTI